MSNQTFCEALYHDAEAEVQQLRTILTRIDNIHVPTDDDEGKPMCQHDLFPWPCWHHRALHPEENIND